MKNKVELLGHYGSDEIIALSAWTSTSRDLSEEKRQRIPALIKKLWSEGHETPFEKGSVHFLVTCDIASHIHLLKHRIASINAESARYKELKEDKVYIPEDWTRILIKDDVNGTTWATMLETMSTLSNKWYHQCVEELTPILGRKRAKESARFFKTYNSQITADVQFNIRSFANFLKLRWNDHAQIEIQQIAKEMFELVSNIEGNPFEETLKQINPHVRNQKNSVQD